jgi:hypothetical protein
MIRFKADVRIRYCTHQLCNVLALTAAWSSVERVEVEVNSIDDGPNLHMTGSLHGFGLAIDLDTVAENAAELERLAGFLRRALEPQYDIVMEGTHVHVEWDARRGKLRALAEP